MSTNWRKTCKVVREAVRTKQSLTACYRGTTIIFCPHALGQDRSGSVVLAFLLTVEPTFVAERMRSPRRWRWLSVAELEEVAVAGTRWWSAPGHTRPRLAGCRIEVEAA